MIKNHEDILKAIETIDFGAPTFKIEVNKTGIEFKCAPFPGKGATFEPVWLGSTITWALSRKFDKESKNWKLHPEAITKIEKGICDEVLNVIRKCSIAKEVSRTSLYKEYRVINAKQMNNPAYYSDVIGIINYYYSSTTDTKCKPNVIGLFELLRKKYGTGSAGSTSSS